MARSAIYPKYFPALIVWLLALTSISENPLPAADLSSTDSLPINRGVGQRFSNFTLKDATSDRDVMLYGFQGKKAVVLAFLGIDCPLSNLYIPRLMELNRAYADKGVVFIGVNSNAHESEDAIRKHAKEYGINFPVVKDTRNVVADVGFVERTCEVIVLDGAARIRYRGAIDDQYGQASRKASPNHSYLRDALDSILTKKPIAVEATKAFGCILDRVQVEATVKAPARRVRAAVPEVAGNNDEEHKLASAKVGQPTYAKDIAPIIQNKCQSCHRPGQVAPFDLLTYDDAHRHSAMIREVVDERRMPPWHADARYGHFANDRRLSVQERATLLAWIDQGAPLGNPKDAPTPKTFSDGWSIGTPDVVFEIPETYLVPPQGVVEYVNMRVPTNFNEDRWIQAAEAVPGERSVVHHIIVYLDDHTNPRSITERHLCGYAPGDMPSVYPPGTAKRVPAGCDLVFQLHYTPNGKMHKDRSKVGLIFAKEPVTREAFTVGIVNDNFLIPANQDEVPVASSLKLAKEIRLLSFMPHMHLRGKRFKYTITKPGEPSKIALSVPAYDFGWQSYYILDEPMTLPPGTTIDCLAHFDNSDKNPSNPDPTKLVRWGDQTFNEMMIGYIDIDMPIGSKRSDIGEFKRGEELPIKSLVKLQQQWRGRGSKPAAADARKAPAQGTAPSQK